jgi:hypothetical protein
MTLWDITVCAAAVGGVLAFVVIAVDEWRDRRRKRRA